MFGATNIVKNSYEETWVYSGYGITFDGGGSWIFGDDFARNTVTSGFDNNSSSHADNHENNFLSLGEGPTYGINGSFGEPEKKSSISLCLSLHYNHDNNYCIKFDKINTKFSLSFDFNKDNSYLFVNEKKSVSLKMIIKSFLKGNIYDFQLITMLLINLTY